jgi:hypothetical protein
LHKGLKLWTNAVSGLTIFVENGEDFGSKEGDDAVYFLGSCLQESEIIVATAAR